MQEGLSRDNTVVVSCGTFVKHDVLGYWDIAIGNAISDVHVPVGPGEPTSIILIHTQTYSSHFQIGRSVWLRNNLSLGECIRTL